MTNPQHRRTRSVLTLLCALGLGACAGDIVDVPSPADAPEETRAELAFPTTLGPVTNVFYAGRELPVEEIEGEFVYEGDILLHPSMVAFEPMDLVLEQGEEPSETMVAYQGLTARTSSLWDDGAVAYTIASGHPSRDLILAAIAHWEENTSLTFEERTTESDYLYFRETSGCSSYIGRIGGQQSVNIGRYCSTGNIIHEIGHAVGLWHEHSRADRNSWVTIHRENIQDGRDHNFYTYEEYGFDGQELTDALDFNSIMMYGSYSFSRNGQPTITRTDGSTYRVQRSGLSTDDIEGLATLYPEPAPETAPEPEPEPEYVNGQTYVIHGVTVLRYYDRWYYYSRIYGWKQVVLRGEYWYYA